MQMNPSVFEQALINEAWLLYTSLLIPGATLLNIYLAVVKLMTVDAIISTQVLLTASK